MSHIIKKPLNVWLHFSILTIIIGGIFCYWIALYRYATLNSSQVLTGLFALILILGGSKIDKWKTLILPLLLTAIVYDSQRMYSDFLRGPIHITEPYQFDLNFFGIQFNELRLTPNEWWQQHLHPVLDFFCGIAYIVFILEFFIFAAYLLFFFGNREAVLAKQMLYGFFWLNVLGYSTYYWYAAAPPWYVALYGMGPADLSVMANLAGCARFDQLVGVPVFKTWYGQSADVFGAVPSLHVAYPFLAILYSFRAKKLRRWSIFFFCWVAFSAVYLNHHYVLDIIWGCGYAMIVWLFPIIFKNAECDPHW